MDKRTIVLCLILVLLVVVVLNRWETTKWETGTRGAVLYQQDRLTSLIHYSVLVERFGHNYKYYQNPYITHGITAFLYLSIGATVIALLRETKLPKGG